MSNERIIEIVHRVLNEETGEEEQVVRSYQNNVTEKATYITTKWCIDVAQYFQVGSTTSRDLRDEEKPYYYEAADGVTTRIVQIDGVRESAERFVWTFTEPNGDKFDIVVETYV